MAFRKWRNILPYFMALMTTEAFSLLWASYDISVHIEPGMKLPPGIATIGEFKFLSLFGAHLFSYLLVGIPLTALAYRLSKRHREAGKQGT